ncbi:dihydrolipoamide acetyltransferase family protein [Phormidium tenue]|uniref:Dihydrolipoamide acetyltransferase component of pyruvate dehydrogenase complex n=1 Tax=Phormidium tenue NIES-30 TaxID=549789 RepID=A0A1U7JBX4_9CYAN|nr:dihydrolipoamide acetyltransferase family protein [Phormidium tenue]MBD2230404.1 2-oxo acid dehydrogenase subunit E2 [Phormidium tenue FACHB-1052]OKH51226.1 branched-chain alpha-keto acid dehydrogenase subunit E2 [Phormidium tenue NIES-30]
MIREVFMPALSSTMTEGKIVSWVKAPGDRVEKGETVVIVESDKADMDVESFHEGILAAIVVEAGGTAPVGEAIALLAETEAEVEAAKQQAAAKAGAAGGDSSPSPEAAAPVAVVEAPSSAAQNGASSGSRSGRVVISPRARKLAKDLKVDLGTLQGSGPHGRIVAQDVELAAGKNPTVTGPVATPLAAVVPPVSAAPVAPAASAAPAAPAPSAAPLGQVVPFNTLQQAVTRNMVASLAVPTYHVGYTITTDSLDALYKQIKSKGVTMTALLAKAVAVTLQKHPLLNAGFTDQGVQYHSGINIAVAVAMEGGGLITPVLKHADQADIYSLSRTWADLVARSRSKQLQPDEYTSGTFTLSNLGMFGVDRFDAILPPGQGSILAIGASRPTVVATAEGLMGVKRQMQVNITCDHRIIYGADAAAFLKDLANVIENNPQSLTL